MPPPSRPVAGLVCTLQLGGADPAASRGERPRSVHPVDGLHHLHPRGRLPVGQAAALQPRAAGHAGQLGHRLDDLRGAGRVVDHVCAQHADKPEDVRCYSLLRI